MNYVNLIRKIKDQKISFVSFIFGVGLLFCFLLSSLIGTLLLYLENNKLKEDEKSNQMKIQGYIRTTGLTNNEKAELNLKYSDYQLTDHADKFQIPRGYFIEFDIDKSYLGKCVLLWGVSEDPSKKSAYDYQTIVPDEIVILEYKHCERPGWRYPNPEEDELSETTTGILRHHTRPAPDIREDYKLVKQDGTEIFVSTPSDDLIETFENYIDKEITLQGITTWGYSETKVFEAYAIKLKAQDLP